MNQKNDIEEISNHIKEILNENKENTVETNIETKLLEWEEISKEDVFKFVNKDEEITTKIDINLNKRICDICKKTINLEENLSGLVVHDSHFLCKKCCQESTKEKLDKWITSKMAKPGDLKPVALWLMKEKNKNKLF